MQTAPQSTLFKVTCLLLSVCACTFILYIAQDIIIPIVLASFFAILLSPVVMYLETKKVPRVLAITISIILTLVVLAGVVYFVSLQLSSFVEKLPDLEKKMETLLTEGIRQTAQAFHLKTGNIQHWLSDLKADFIADSRTYIGTTLTTLTGILAIMILLPVYTIMMLYFEPLFMTFVQKIVPPQKHTITQNILMESKSVMQNYLLGLMMEAVIVAILNTCGLLILGIDYAILWAIIGALLNTIPYIGIAISTVFPFTMALVTKDPTHAFLVLLVYAIVQFIDNNIIVPKVVASRVQVNALTAIIVVIIGGTLWGIAGMFMALPLIAIVKIIFDRIPHLQPYGYLIGDQMPAKASFFKRLKKTLPENKPAKS
jgi:predicted PurR-regulated permease PerM